MDDVTRRLSAVLMEHGGLPRNEARRSAIVHRKKFMDGKMTPEEAHQRYGIPPDAKCQCGRRPLITCRVFMPLDEMIKRDGEFVGRSLARDPEGFYKTLVEFTHGTHVRVTTTYACKGCEPTLDKVAAKAPSWCVVEFNRGPGAEKIVSGYTGGA